MNNDMMLNVNLNNVANIDEIMREINDNPYLAELITDPDVIKEVVRHDGLLLERVYPNLPDGNDFISRNQKERIIYAALEENYWAIQFVPEEEQTIGMAMFCVEQEGDTLRFIADKYHTFEVCKAAAKSNPNSLYYVHEQTEEICMEYIKADGEALYYVEEQTEEMCWLSFLKYPENIKYVKNQPESMCFMAIEYDPDNLCYINNRTAEMNLLAVRKKGTAIAWLSDKEKTPEICRVAVEQDGRNIRLVPREKRTVELNLLAVQNTWKALAFLEYDEQDMGLVYTALKQSLDAIEYSKMESRYNNMLLSLFD